MFLLKNIALSSNDKRKHSIDSIKIYPYGMNKKLVCKKEEIKCNNKIKQLKNVKLWLYYKRRLKTTKFKLARNS